jgi:hypothetical protein
MPKNPDLVPTVIVDVNGRTTIVHKLRRLFGGSSSPSASRIPAPSPTPAAPVLKEGASKPAVVKSLMKMLPVKADRTEARVLSNNLYNHFPLESLKWFAGVLADGGTLAEGVGNHLATAHFTVGVVGQIDAAQVEKEIINNVFFYPLLGIDDYAEVKKLVWSLKMTDKFKDVNDFSTLSEDEKNRCAATMVAAYELKKKYPAVGGHPLHPVDTPSLLPGVKGAILKEPLYSFVFNNPNEMAEIVDTVVEHKTMDPVELRGLMSGITRPLAGGAL